MVGADDAAHLANHRLQPAEFGFDSLRPPDDGQLVEASHLTLLTLSNWVHQQPVMQPFDVMEKVNYRVLDGRPETVPAASR